MNDETRLANDTVQNIAQYGGWLGAAMGASWGWVMKIILGRHLRTMDNVIKELARINSRLSRIEGRFEERDHRLDER